MSKKMGLYARNGRGIRMGLGYLGIYVCPHGKHYVDNYGDRSNQCIKCVLEKLDIVEKKLFDTQEELKSFKIGENL